MAAAARDLLADGGYAADPIYLTDLDRVTPASALASELRPHTWQTLPYETDHLSGVLLWAGFESQAPAVSYPLDRRGWHAISVGFHPTTEDQGWLEQVLVKLSGDDTYSMLRWEPPRGLDGHTRRLRFEELFWRVARLDGQDLVFEQITRRLAAGDGPGTIQGESTKIAYVKLVPLSDAEAAAHERDLRDASTHRLFGHNDAFYPYTYRTTTAEEIRREVEPYRETDFGRIYWEVGGGDKLYYDTTVGRNPADLDLQGYSRLGERLLVESFREFRRKASIRLMWRCGTPTTWGWSSTPATGWRRGPIRRPPWRGSSRAGISSGTRSCTASTGRDESCRGCPMHFRKLRSFACRCCASWRPIRSTASRCCSTGDRRTWTSSSTGRELHARVRRGPARPGRARSPLAGPPRGRAHGVHAAGACRDGRRQRRAPRQAD